MKNLTRFIGLSIIVINFSFANNVLLAEMTSLSITCQFEGYYSSLMNQMFEEAPVTVSLHKSNPPYEEIASVSTILNTGGTAIALEFDIPLDTAYFFYIVVRNWNMIETWSAEPQIFYVPGITEYVFSTDAGKAFGDNMKQVDDVPLVWGMYIGDVYKDVYEVIDASDVAELDLAMNSYATGDLATDLNGDEAIDVDDMIIVFNNANNFVAAMKPGMQP